MRQCCWEKNDTLEESNKKRSGNEIRVQLCEGKEEKLKGTDQALGPRHVISEKKTMFESFLGDPNKSSFGMCFYLNVCRIQSKHRDLWLRVLGLRHNAFGSVCQMETVE